MTAPRRRWSFGIRTLLLGVTLLCVGLGWIGWELSIVRARKAFVKKLDGASVAYAVRPLSQYGQQWFAARDSTPPTVPIVRRLLGDEAVVDIEFGSASIAMQREAKQLFPEAYIHSFDFPLGFELGDLTSGEQ